MTSRRLPVVLAVELDEWMKTWGAPDSSFRAFSLHPLQKSKIRHQKIKRWSLRNDFRDAAQLPKWEVNNSFFEGYEVI